MRQWKFGKRRKPSSSYCVMQYFWWGCRRNYLTLITLGSKRINTDPSPSPYTVRYTRIYSFFLVVWDSSGSIISRSFKSPMYFLHRDVLPHRVSSSESCVLNRVYNFTFLFLKQGYLPKIQGYLSQTFTHEQFPVSGPVLTCCSSMQGNVCMEQTYLRYRLEKGKCLVQFWTGPHQFKLLR